MLKPCLGIDPGKGGALAVVQAGDVRGIWDTPETYHGRASLIATIKETFPGVVAAIERPLYGFTKKRKPQPDEPPPMTPKDLRDIQYAMENQINLGASMAWLVAETRRRFEEDDERKFSNPTSIAKLHKDAGIWCGILEAIGIPYEEPTPQQWGKFLNGRASGKRQKDRSRDYTSKRFARHVHGSRGGYKDGRGDALVIALDLESKQAHGERMKAEG